MPHGHSAMKYGNLFRSSMSPIILDLKILGKLWLRQVLASLHEQRETQLEWRTFMYPPFSLNGAPQQFVYIGVAGATQFVMQEIIRWNG
jgi:hypothetical protein